MDFSRNEFEKENNNFKITPEEWKIGTGTIVFIVAFVIIYLLFIFFQDKIRKNNMNGSPYGSVNVVGDLLNKDPVNIFSSIKRKCLVSESRCPTPPNGKPKKCVGVNGQPIDPAAVENDSTYCCTFGCETEIPTYRHSCRSNETLCNVSKNRRVCTMDKKVILPSSMLFSGSQCCEYDCFDWTSLPERACYPEEVICPGRSYCYNFSNEITVPNATNEQGNACCPQTGRQVCVNL